MEAGVNPDPTRDHGQLKAMVRRASDLSQDAREASERDRDYYDGYQWTAAELAVLKKRKQPPSVINRIKRKVDAMVGIEQRGRSDPKCLPRGPQDEQAADIATKALRFVEEKERLDQKRSAAFENLLVEGYGGVEVVAKPYGDHIDPCVRKLRWEEIIFDPHSREKDFSDAAYIGILKWMTVDAARTFARDFWDGTPEELDAMLDTSPMQGEGQTFEDRPYGDGGMAWVDHRQKRVRVASMYHRVGDGWALSIFTGKGVLFDGPSPYLDENGKPDCAIILMSAYVDRENRRYGVVRDLIPIQDEINKRRSRALALLSNRQTMGTKGAVDAAEVKRQLAMPDGHVEVDTAAFDPEVGMKPFEVLSTNDLAMGQFNLLQEAKQEIDMLGPNASLLGQLSGQQSGRAIMAQQQAGMAELAPIYDSLADWTERVYRAVWCRIKQFWQEPRWIRVTEDEQAPQFFGVNQPQMVMTPMGPQVQVQNLLAEMDIDIIISQSPDYASLRAEQFEQLSQLAGRGVPIPPKVLIMASELPDKDKLMAALEPPPEVQQQVQQQQMAMQQRAFEAEMGVKESQAMKNQAAAAKDMAEIPAVRAKAVQEAVRAAAAPDEAAKRVASQPEPRLN
jgi:hypothetical protein